MSALTITRRAVTQAARSARGFAGLSSEGVTATLPDLTYDYAELEPHISAEIMEIHHSKHHATYVANFNAAMEAHDAAGAKGDLAAQIALQGAINFNGGGHINHSLFWENLSPNGGGAPAGELAGEIDKAFGSFDDFKAKFAAQTVAVQGSGWGWLAYNPASDGLAIQTCANQDPLSKTGLVPLMGVDVWEHAYYLQYKNVRPSYLEAIWNVIDFDCVAARLAAAKK